MDNNDGIENNIWWERLSFYRTINKRMEGQGSSSGRKVVPSSGKFEYNYEFTRHHVSFKVPYKNLSDQDHDLKKVQLSMQEINVVSFVLFKMLFIRTYYFNPIFLYYTIIFVPEITKYIGLGMLVIIIHVVYSF